jgi:tetratricopeptide (TPR) repeat protein
MFRVSTLLVTFSLLVSSTAARADDGAWLEKAGEQAVVLGKYPRAISLIRGLAALRPHDPSPIYRLAEVYALAGQYEEASAEYRRFAARIEADPARKARAESEAKRLEEAPAPFTEQLFKPAPATEEAKRLFDEGKKDAQAKRFGPAVNELQAALLLDPDLPGPYRLLGAVYGKTGDRVQETLFLADYLRVRPDGAIADAVRGRLKQQKLLGTLSLDASWPCSVTINGRDLGKSTPLKEFALPAGKYLVDLENKEFHIIGRLRFDVTVGKDNQKRFKFGVLQTKLDPWARIRIDGKDVGLFDEVGVPEGRHHVEYQAHDGSKQKTVEIELKDRQRQKLSW